MRRTYISPEYTYSKVYGTFNTLEQSSFFGSKMLKITDTVSIDNQNIIYYQNQNNEQLDLSVESLLPSVVYSSSVDKQTNHTLVIDPSQSDIQKNNLTSWVMTIDLETILTDYVYALIKQSRTFNGVHNYMTSNGDVSFSMKDYIKKNVFNRYRFDHLKLFLTYNSLPNSSSQLRFQNTWDNTINLTSNQLTKFQTNTTYDSSSVIVTFLQQQPSTLYNFNYFFSLYWVRL